MGAVAAGIDCRLLEQAGETFAAGFMERPEASPLWRMCRGLQRMFATAELPPYGGEALYPCNGALYPQPQAVQFHYSASMLVNWALLESKTAEAESDQVRDALIALAEDLRDYPMVRGYTHSIINFGRVLQEGLDSYEQRLREHLAIACERHEGERQEFCEALLLLLDALRSFHGRVCDMLAAVPGPDAAVLVDALRHVPFGPARGFYEAVVATNFLYYIDGCDDLGRFDQDLWRYYRDDLQTGAITRDQALAWVGQVFANVDASHGWNVAIGGTAADGSQGCNDLTMVCLEAAKGRRRPNLALRLRRDTPEAYWDQALDTISGGTGIPALYNEEEYLRALREAHLGVSESDLPHYAFGGCTELMVHGCSNVGSLDDVLNVLLSLEGCLHNHLPQCSSFTEFLDAFKADLARDVRALCERVSQDQERKGRWQPQPIRTLLVDDCIDNGREYNAGGARYNWSVISLAGLPNTYDSLAAVKLLVFDRAEVGAEELLQALRADFVGYEELRGRLERCPRYGNDDPYVDELAAEVSEHVFREFMRHAPWRGGKFLASCLMFVTYGTYGEEVGATPDGRLARTPVGDSAGAFQGRDRSGPTALLRSVTRVPHSLAPGTLVHNIRFTKRLFDDPEARQQLKSLVRTYFDLGGMQLQINVVDQRILRQAIEHPEQHQDLIIRVGGYSEYFHRLSPDLQLSVLERVEHG